MRRPLLAIAALAFAVGLAPPGWAEPYGNPAIVQVPHGVGCYWYRGRLNCSRYCYWEIDGYRYCTRRLREAHSQAPELLFGEEPYPPYRRHRSAK